MYHTAFPPQAMVQVVGSYQSNGQFLPVQGHAYYINSGSPSNLSQSDFPPIPHSTNTTNHNRHHTVQANSYPFQLLHLMRVENSPRRTSFNAQSGESTNGNKWHQRFSSPSKNHNDSTSLNVPRSNYRPVSAGSAKKPQNWQNISKQGKRHSYNDLSSLQDSCNSSDSGLSSRSPTPNKYYKDGNQNESSDEPDSINSFTESCFKNTKQISNANFYRNGMAASAAAQQLSQIQRHTDTNTPRSQHQNFQNKRRYNTPRTSPPLRTQRPRKFPGIFIPGFNMYPRFIFTAPDYFLQKAQLMHSRQIPTNLLVGSTYDKLSSAIWEKFENNQQTEVTFSNKMHLWKALLVYIKSKFPQYGLFMVGSTLNGFGSESSDVDMCLLLRSAEMDQKNEAIFRLEQILRCLKKCEFINHLELIQAKVPILKFHNTSYNLDVDLNCNNAVGIRNTHLLYCYSRIDWRVRPLVLIVKMWAQCQNINDARNMTISSYSLVLMVIHFLQCGVSPPVLPCLHNIFKGKFDPFSDVYNIDIQEELIIPSSTFEQKNHQTLGELLIGFFKYYDTFNYDQYAISIRTANKIPIEECRLVRSYKNDPFQWKNGYLCIEEPFDFTNTARSVYDAVVFAKIKEVFKETYRRLKKTCNLSSIFIKIESN